MHHANLFNINPREVYSILIKENTKIQNVETYMVMNRIQRLDLLTSIKHLG